MSTLTLDLVNTEDGTMDEQDGYSILQDALLIKVTLIRSSCLQLSLAINC